MFKTNPFVGFKFSSPFQSDVLKDTKLICSVNFKEIGRIYRLPTWFHYVPRHQISHLLPSLESVPLDDTRGLTHATVSLLHWPLVPFPFVSDIYKIMFIMHSIIIYAT